MTFSLGFNNQNMQRQDLAHHIDGKLLHALVETQIGHHWDVLCQASYRVHDRKIAPDHISYSRMQHLYDVYELMVQESATAETRYGCGGHLYSDVIKVARVVDGVPQSGLVDLASHRQRRDEAAKHVHRQAPAQCYQTPPAPR